MPVIILALLSRSLPPSSSITRCRGHVAGPSCSPPPHYGTCVHYIGRIIQRCLPSSTRVELYLPTC